MTVDLGKQRRVDEAAVWKFAQDGCHSWKSSGHGLDDVALVQTGAGCVVGIDYSQVAVRAAQRRADELGAACRYVAAAVPGVPLASASADLVYTGKGALIWMPDLTRWARDVARMLRPSGHLFVYEAHPAVTLWTWDEDLPRIREDGVAAAAWDGRLPNSFALLARRTR